MEAHYLCSIFALIFTLESPTHRITLFAIHTYTLFHFSLDAMLPRMDHDSGMERG